MTLPGTQKADAADTRNWLSQHWQYVLLTAFVAAIFTLRMAAPSSLLDQDQERPASYVLDVIKNGNWLCQKDLSGEIASKPPLYTWVCALVALASGGHVSLFTLYFPCALALWGTTVIIYSVGGKYFGQRAGFLGAFLFLLTGAAVKQAALARTDTLFTFTVTLAAWLAFRAWNEGRGWTWFWLTAAAATLTKGPLGLALAGGGLVATIWEKRSGKSARLRGSHILGIVLFLALAGGWFGLACWEQGPAVYKKLLGEELADQAIEDRSGNRPGRFFYQPPLYYMARAAPGSLLTIVGLWGAFRRSETNDVKRRFERFCCAWLGTGLLIFAIAPHQRGDHLWPLIPAGALLAGRELDRLTKRLSAAALLGMTTALAAIFVASFSYYYAHVRGQLAVVHKEAEIKKLAASITAALGPEPTLSFIDAPEGLQFYLNTSRPCISATRAAGLLRSQAAAYVALNYMPALEQARQLDDPPFYKLIEIDTVGRKPEAVRPTYLIGNRPALAPAEDIVFSYGKLDVSLHAMRLTDVAEHRLRLAADAENATAQVTNQSAEPRSFEIEIAVGGKHLKRSRLIQTNETWTVSAKD